MYLNIVRIVSQTLQLSAENNIKRRDIHQANMWEFLLFI